jgi:hypothetical protein
MYFIVGIFHFVNNFIWLMADEIEPRAPKKARIGWYNWLFPTSALQCQTEKLVQVINPNPPSPHLLFQNLPVEAPHIDETWKLRNRHETIPSSVSQTPSRKFGSSSINRMRTNSNFSGSTNTNSIRKSGPLKLLQDKVNYLI